MSNKLLLAWNEINWPLVEKRISRQQNRVYRASMEGNKAKVHALQRRIIASLDAKLVAVKRVTTENKGRVKGQRAISHVKKMELVNKLKLDGKTSSSRRIYVSKPGKSNSRPQGIQTIEDRAKQMLAKLALEPEWEAIFEPNSYGFRPGRSCHDAIASIFLSLRGKSRYVLDADIQKCFDQIDHDKLIKKLATFEIIENQIKAWLKANIMVEPLNRPDEVIKSIEGIPQVEIISSLLINIVFHDLENSIKNWYADSWYPKTGKSTKVAKRDRKASIGISRYLDNFIIIAPRRIDIEEIKNQVEIWLYNEVGLKLSKAKIRIVNSTEGFEFLGFQIISIKKDTGEYKVKIHPSKSSKAQIIKSTRKIIQANRSASSYNLNLLLSPRIIGWAEYFKTSECSKDFAKIDYLIFNQVRAWVFRRKSKNFQARTKLKEKYFPSEKLLSFRGKKYLNNWILHGQTKIKGKLKENFLPKMVWVGSSQHIKIKGNASPYDKNHFYWAKRTEKYSGFCYSTSKLIKKQKGCCAVHSNGCY